MGAVQSWVALAIWLTGLPIAFSQSRPTMALDGAFRWTRHVRRVRERGGSAHARTRLGVESLEDRTLLSFVLAGPFATLPGASDEVVADFNGDGKQDLLVTSGGLGINSASLLLG